MTPEQSDTLRSLVNAVVQLAVYRYDLERDGYGIDEGEAHDLAEDLFGALQGETTCAEEPCDEWVAVAKLFNASEARIAELEAALLDAGEKLHQAAEELAGALVRAGRAEAKLAKAVYALRCIGEGDCAYGDGCPPFGSRHGRCDVCIANGALAEFEKPR